MEYRTISKTGIEVSAVALGTWAIGGSSWGPADDGDSMDTIGAALDMGVTLIDTAPVYGHGHAEELVGLALKGKREKSVIATKCGLLLDDGYRRSLDPRDIQRELEDSLRRLRTDYVDIYFFHRPDKNTPIEVSIEKVERLKQEGKIRCYGVSNFSRSQLERAVACGTVDFIQDQYSLVHRAVEKDLIPVCEREGIGLLAYAPLGGGILTGKYREKPNFRRKDIRNTFYPFYQEPYWSKTMTLLESVEEIAARIGKSPAQIAIAWVNSRSHVASSLVGARSIDQLRENAGAGAVGMDRDALAVLTEQSDSLFE